MSTVESKLYGKSLVEINTHNTGDGIKCHFSTFDLVPHVEKEKVNGFSLADLPIRHHKPEHVPEISRWTFALDGVPEEEYVDHMLSVLHLDRDGNTVRVLGTERLRNGRYCITHVASSCELMIVRVREPQFGGVIKTFTAFFISSDCVVSDSTNSLIAIDAYHRYNNHTDDSVAKKTLARIFGRKPYRSVFEDENTMLGINFNDVSSAMREHVWAVKELSRSLSSNGLLAASHRDSLKLSSGNSFAIAYEDVKAHIGQGAEFVGGIILVGGHNANNRYSDNPNHIYDAETFHKVVDLCTQHNADPESKHKMQVILFPKNRRDVYYAVPSLDEFNRVHELANGLHLLNGVFEKYQYVKYIAKDFMCAYPAESAVEDDNDEIPSYRRIIKPSAEDSVFLSEFTRRIADRVHYGFVGNSVKDKVEGRIAEFVSDDADKQKVVRFMRDVNQVSVDAHEEHIASIPNRGKPEYIVVKAVGVKYLVDVRTNVPPATEDPKV